MAQIKTEFEQSGGEWKDFKIGDLFEKIKTNKLSYKAKELPNEKSEVYCLSALTAGSVNQGLCGYVPKDNATVLQNVISVSANAAGVAFFQSNPFTVLQDSYAIKAKKHNLTQNQYLYILSPLQKVLSNYNWNKKSGWERVKKDVVTLPTLNNELALAYMQQYISELEQQYISELEQQYISELDTYLRVTGLENYELTDKEKLVLNIPKKEQLFRIGDLFTLNKGKLLSKRDILPNGAIPVYSSASTNNGIIGYCNQKPQFIIDKKNPFYLVFGDHTRTMNVVQTDFCITDNVKVLTPKISSIKTIFYICSVWKKKIPNLGYARHWSKAKTVLLSLPVVIDGKLDLDFMETYIRAVEKKAIQNVVKWKNLEITKTKQVVNDSK